MKQWTRPLVATSKGRWGAKVPPAEWRQRLMTVEPPARYACARIVWWEFFSMRLMPERWGHIDMMLRRRDEVPDDVLVEALVQVGAPRAWAEKRVIVKPRARRKVGGKWT